MKQRHPVLGTLLVALVLAAATGAAVVATNGFGEMLYRAGFSGGGATAANGDGLRLTGSLGLTGAGFAVNSQGVALVGGLHGAGLFALPTEGEGTVEGMPEGEGEGEGLPEGEGTVDGEGLPEGEGEGLIEGEGEGVFQLFHSADQDQNNLISLSELLRVIQFFNSGGYQCAEGTEDGYAPNLGNTDCTPHSSDYNPQNWIISLSELLRLIQFFNAGGYFPCPELATEDGFCPGLPG